MATSGSGDVLSGILAGLSGYLDFNLLTISAGVLLNGLAGEIADEKYTDISKKWDGITDKDADGKEVVY